ncbi:MAG: hypothetical protein ACKO86_28085, partial [Dolichospermum sp.]
MTLKPRTITSSNAKQTEGNSGTKDKKLAISMTLRFWLTTVSTTIVSVTTLYFGLNYSKFCFKEMRYLNDKEKIQMVFN